MRWKKAISRTTSYLRDLASEFGESTNAIRMVLNHLEQAGLLNSYMQGNKKLCQANSQHPLFSNIHELLLKHTGIDHVVDHVAKKLGGLQRAWVVGSFARGRGNHVIDTISQHVSICEPLLQVSPNWSTCRWSGGYDKRR